MSEPTKDPGELRARGKNDSSALHELPAMSPRRHEIKAALDAAFDLENNAFSQGLNASSEEIGTALEAVFPPKLCTRPPPRHESLEDQDVFEIFYDWEMTCLMNEGLIDRQWVPSGMLWFSDRPETR